MPLSKKFFCLKAPLQTTGGVLIQVYMADAKERVKSFVAPRLRCSARRRDIKSC